MSDDPAMRAVAPTVPCDLEVMGDISRCGTTPGDLVRALEIPTPVIAGGASREFLQDTAPRIAELLPNGNPTILEDLDDGAPADAVAPVIAAFLPTRSTD